MKHWYMSHLGHLYSSDKRYTDKELYCELCEDYDTYLGKFKTKKEAEKAYNKYLGLEENDD